MPGLLLHSVQGIDRPMTTLDINNYCRQDDSFSIRNNIISRSKESTNSDYKIDDTSTKVLQKNKSSTSGESY